MLRASHHHYHDFCGAKGEALNLLHRPVIEALVNLRWLCGGPLGLLTGISTDLQAQLDLLQRCSPEHKINTFLSMLTMNTPLRPLFHWWLVKKVQCGQSQFKRSKTGSLSCHLIGWQIFGLNSNATTVLKKWARQHPVHWQRVLCAEMLLVIYGTVGFILRDPTAFPGDDEVSVQGRSGTVSGASDQTCFPSFFSPQLEAIVSRSCDGSLSSAEIYLSEDNWPLNPHLTTVKMPTQE